MWVPEDGVLAHSFMQLKEVTALGTKQEWRFHRLEGGNIINDLQVYQILAWTEQLVIKYPPGIWDHPMKWRGRSISS